MQLSRMLKLGAALAILLAGMTGVWAWGYSIGMNDVKKATEVICHGDPGDCVLGSPQSPHHFEVVPAPYIVPATKEAPQLWAI